MFTDFLCMISVERASNLTIWIFMYIKIYDDFVL